MRLFFCLLDILEYLERFAIQEGGVGIVVGLVIIVALVVLVALDFIDALVI